MREMPVMQAESDRPKPRKTEKVVREAVLGVARERFEDFFQDMDKSVNAYFGTPDITFTCKPGGFYIDLEKITVNMDPKFFIERGYSESESVFGLFHEAEHFRDLIRDPDAYRLEHERIMAEANVHPAYPKALSRLVNCLDDITVNNSVAVRWSAGARVENGVYPKLFQDSDFRFSGPPDKRKPTPRHRQLMYAILRQAMLPSEPCTVDGDVEKAIETWQEQRKTQSTPLQIGQELARVDAHGTPIRDKRERSRLTQSLLEPLFRELYLEDLKDRKDKDKEEGEGEGGDPFDSDDFDDAMPDQATPEEKLDAIEKLRNKIAKDKKDKFKELMGVDQKDFESYQKDFRTVEKHVDRLSHTFEKVIQRRKSYRRQLRQPTTVDQGLILNPPRAATAVAEIQGGNLNPKVMLKFRKKEQIRNLPNRFELTLVCDGSGSMSQGRKAKTQRELAIMACEAFVRLQERVQAERRSGENINLDLLSEVRMFSDSDSVLKPLSNSFTHPERVKMHKILRQPLTGSNNEPATFEAIRDEQFDKKRLAGLKEGTLKKMIIFLTDGGTEKPKVQAKIKELRTLAGPLGQENLVIAAIGFDQGIEVKDVYAPNGFYADNLEKVIEIFEQILEQIMDEL